MFRLVGVRTKTVNRHLVFMRIIHRSSSRRKNSESKIIIQKSNSLDQIRYIYKNKQFAYLAENYIPRSKSLPAIRKKANN